MARTYCVYILASRSRTLYVGVTNDLERRLRQHRDRITPGFTSRYQIFELVHYEVFGDVRLAIAREKEIKGWRREKKLQLIREHNPPWEDLAERLARQRAAENNRIRSEMQTKRKSAAAKTGSQPE